MKRRLAVASKNPVKINATLRGFESTFPEYEFTAEGFDIHSGVNDQPITDSETRLGAYQRASRVLELSDAEFAIGIEGGIETIDGKMYAFAWIVIQDAEQSAQARSGTYLLPPEIQRLVEEGNELGIANDIVFRKKNSKQKGGAIGSLTNNVISRQQLYEHAITLALLPWLNPELF